ncbi:hypothetical protein ACK3TF_000952 [Chlorella vulgaris]
MAGSRLRHCCLAWGKAQAGSRTFQPLLASRRQRHKVRPRGTKGSFWVKCALPSTSTATCSLLNAMSTAQKQQANCELAWRQQSTQSRQAQAGNECNNTTPEKRERDRRGESQV